MRILVADPLADEGIERLRSGGADVAVRTGLTPDQLAGALDGADALIVRSQTRVTRSALAAAACLRVIGRAGVGVDNIDVDAASERGIVVVNAPTGNNTAAAEHTLALLFALARHIPQADASLRRGKWERGRFVGVELSGKTLGVVGLGRIGGEVAQRARGLGMQVVAYDPFLPAEHTRRLGIELLPLDALLERADFVTIHTPLTPATRGLIGERELARMRPTARLVNVARGGIVDEQALATAVEAGRIAGAAVDVFVEEPVRESPLLRSERIIVTPHLGASTEEAQVNVAVDVADQVLAVLHGKPARYAVNLPYLPPETEPVVAPFLPLAELLGRVVVQLADGQLGSIAIRCCGEIAGHDTGLLRAAALTGLLAPVTDEPINLVNAPLIARRRGLSIAEQHVPDVENYASLVSLAVATDRGTATVSGTVMRGDLHIVELAGYWIDVVPAVGALLVTEHLDRPGMIGAVGTVLGRANVNISFMQVGRQRPRGPALMVLGIDDPVEPAVVAEIRRIPNMQSARVVRL